jgi:hypothetical protein
MVLLSTEFTLRGQYRRSAAAEANRRFFTPAVANVLDRGCRESKQ